MWDLYVLDGIGFFSGGLDSTIEMGLSRAHSLAYFLGNDHTIVH